MADAHVQGTDARRCAGRRYRRRRCGQPQLGARTLGLPGRDDHLVRPDPGHQRSACARATRRGGRAGRHPGICRTAPGGDHGERLGSVGARPRRSGIRLEGTVRPGIHDHVAGRGGPHRRTGGGSRRHRRQPGSGPRSSHPFVVARLACATGAGRRCRRSGCPAATALPPDLATPRGPRLRCRRGHGNHLPSRPGRRAVEQTPRSALPGHQLGAADRDDPPPGAAG